MQDNRIAFRAPLELRDWLEERAVHAGRGESTDTRARTELDLWRDVLALELQRTGWTVAELSCLATILAGVRPRTRHGWTGQAYDELDKARITDAATMNASYGPAFLAALAGKLRQLGPAGDIALVDAILRWAGQPGARQDRGGFTAVGFTVTEAVPEGARS